MKYFSSKTARSYEQNHNDETIPAAMTTEPQLEAPFPYFGGKSSVADDVWQRFGEVRNYVEPFCGSAAMLLRRPQPWDGIETVNDKDGFISNFWRAVRADPDKVAYHADWPVNENDQHARHIWLVNRKDSMQSRLEGDPDWFDAKIAGWWVWLCCCWIGGGLCSGKGPWQIVVENGVSHLRNVGNGKGIQRKLVHLGCTGRGMNKATVQDRADGVLTWMRLLSDRLRRVRVCCGDWQRVCGPTPTIKQGLTAVFLDPPYSDMAGRAPNLYTEDCLQVAYRVCEWAIANGDHKLMRIALCGYEGEHEMPDTWECWAWKTGGGYGNQAEDGNNENSGRERIWFSPHCLGPHQKDLFT